MAPDVGSRWGPTEMMMLPIARLRRVEPADTDPEARQVQLDAYRAMTGEQRLALGFRLSEELRRVADAGRAHRVPAPAGDGPSARDR